MRNVSSRASCAALVARCVSRVLPTCLLLSASVSAQGPYYVNGQTGTDAAGFGASPSTPWKTVTYAMAQVPPITHPQTSETIFVAGGQSYSPTENGEAFPITPAYNYALRWDSTGGGMPVFDLPTGATAFTFDPQTFYNRNQVTFEALEFHGGDYAFQIGSAPTFRHRPRIQQCRFLDQRLAGIRIANFGNAIEDPRFFQNYFRGPNYGIEIVASGQNAIAVPDIDENEFDDMGSAGIYFEGASNGGNIGGAIRFNRFRGGEDGVVIVSATGAGLTSANITNCHFWGLNGTGVDVRLTQPVSPFVTVRECVFSMCGAGFRMTGVPEPGAYATSIEDCTFQDCGDGVDVDVDPSNGAAGINFVLTCRSSYFRDCASGVGLAFAAGTGSPAINVTLERLKVIRCSSGLNAQLLGNGLLTVQSSILAGCVAGADLAGGLQATLRRVTLADNDVALETSLAGAYDHLIFDGNINNVAGSAPSFAYSAFDNETVSGAGNLSNTSAQLVRPNYKLSRTSPCINAGNLGSPMPPTDYEGGNPIAGPAGGGFAVPDLGADEYAPQGSIAVAGTPGWASFNVVPRIDSPQSTAQVGQPLSVRLTDAGLTPFALLSAGFADEPGPLGFDAAGIGFEGTYLWNEVSFAPLLFTVTNGAANSTRNLPSLAALIGETIVYQWITITPHVGFSSTAGLRVTIGQ